MPSPSHLSERNHVVGSPSIASLVGNLTGAPCISIIAVQTFLAVHRLLAAFRPIDYQKSFGCTKLTMVQLCFSWIWGAGVVTFWEVAPRQYNCSYEFDVASISWFDNCPPFFLTITITIPVYTSAGLVIVINVLILCKLLAINSRLEFATKTDRIRSERRIKRMVIQGISQDSSFLIETFMLNYAIHLSESKTWMFVCCTIAWEITHAIDGAIIFLFNAELQRCGLGSEYSNDRTVAFESTRRQSTMFTILKNKLVNQH
ncbi:hypothetical protein Y032_0210g2143 [Ancylostoma ceylanicum]|uniref:7TM GPCR serpentine receptor class x (Srx) domain-containing protein n=1 Tax=Ancylostoma ceylanicum TaxID=53326 RepID=A0A016SKA9_9BILA|nr:hypothetical protein Y032_0210g2143 [Ancylostoma ceylanicum]